MYRSLFSELASVSLPLADINWSEINRDWLLPIGIALLILFVPHVIAAQIVAPKTPFWKVPVACVLQIVFLIMVVMALAVMVAFGPWYLAAAGAIVFVLSSLVTTGIYMFGFPRGLGYNLIVVALAAGLSYGLVKVYGTEPAKRFVVHSALKWQSRNFTSETAAQSAAVRRFPPLGYSGTAFNQRFLQLNKQYRETRPSLFRSHGWPWVIAGEVAYEFNMLPGFPR